MKSLFRKFLVNRVCGLLKHKLLLNNGNPPFLNLDQKQSGSHSASVDTLYLIYSRQLLCPFDMLLWNVSFNWPVCFWLGTWCLVSGGGGAGWWENPCGRHLRANLLSLPRDVTVTRHDTTRRVTRQDTSPCTAHPLTSNCSCLIHSLTHPLIHSFIHSSEICAFSRWSSNDSSPLKMIKRDLR